MLIKILIGLILIAVALAIAIATRPKTFRVERTLLINAPADFIFPFINDIHLWSRGSPFEKLDPNLLRTFSGAEAGKGATYEWAMSGDNTVAAKAISLVASMDKYLGTAFDEGLSNLERVVEAARV